LEEFQNQFKESDHYEARVVSDGIVLWLKSPTSGGLSGVFRQIAKMQLQFILRTKKFLRGGIAVGSRMVHSSLNNSNLVSNGLARAVKTEEKLVTWPVIGLPRRNLEEINRFLRVPPEETHGLIQGFNDLGDDLFFIDFMQDSQELLGLIRSELERFSQKESNEKLSMRVRAKYLFLLKCYISKFGTQQLPAGIEGAIL
jgi:hypothetical protein